MQPRQVTGILLMNFGGLSAIAMLALVKDMMGTRYIGNMQQALIIPDEAWLVMWLLAGGAFVAGLLLTVTKPEGAGR